MLLYNYYVGNKFDIHCKLLAEIDMIQQVERCWWIADGRRRGGGGRYSPRLLATVCVSQIPTVSFPVQRSLNTDTLDELTGNTGH